MFSNSISCTKTLLSANNYSTKVNLGTFHEIYYNFIHSF